MYRRPFHGTLGIELLQAGERGDFDDVIAIGEQGIRSAVETRDISLPIVLDRSWMTIASLIEPRCLPRFFANWKRWIPTALCWADLGTTVERLTLRTERAEPEALHERYLTIYQDLAERSKSPVVRTDLYSEEACLEFLLRWIHSVEILRS